LRRLPTSKRRYTEAREPSYTKGKPEKHRNTPKNTGRCRKLGRRKTHEESGPVEHSDFFIPS